MNTFHFEPGKSNLSEKLEMLLKLIELAEGKVNHFDKLRQLNFSITILIFAGIFSFAIKENPQEIIKWSLWIILIIFMWILSKYDHSLHKFSHGWRRTKNRLVMGQSCIINNPKSGLVLNLYYKSGEKKAIDEDCNNPLKFWVFCTSQFNKKIKGPSRMRAAYFLFVLGAFLSIIPFMLAQSCP